MQTTKRLCTEGDKGARENTQCRQNCNNGTRMNLKMFMHIMHEKCISVLIHMLNIYLKNLRVRMQGETEIHETD